MSIGLPFRSTFDYRDGFEAEARRGIDLRVAARWTASPPTVIIGLPALLEEMSHV
jgi:hypothetical protein